MFSYNIIYKLIIKKTFLKLNSYTNYIKYIFFTNIDDKHVLLIFLNVDQILRINNIICSFLIKKIKRGQVGNALL